MRLSDKIIELRKERGWSQEDLAERLDVSRQAVSRWENGTALPDAGNILQLSRLFGVTADYLLNDDIAKDDAVSHSKGAHDVSDVKRKRYRHLIASICFLVSAGIWLFLAIVYLEIIYVILTLANAGLSLFQLYLYEKKKDGAEK